MNNPEIIPFLLRLLNKTLLTYLIISKIQSAKMQDLQINMQDKTDWNLLLFQYIL